MFILSPYFFEEVTDGNLQTCTKTSSRYLDILIHYAIPEFQWQNALSKAVWIQDGPPPHVGSLVKCLLGLTEFSPIISHFYGHLGLLISHQWISVCGEM